MNSKKISKKRKEKKKEIVLYKIIIKGKNIYNVLSISSFSFDISHYEITFSLVHGLKIILVDDILNNDTELLTKKKFIIENNVEFIDTTPTRFKLFMENANFYTEVLPIIKVVMFLGEELPIELCRSIHKYSKCRIYNGY
ncbi:hypothetical protein LY90DRAFT_499307 [Neocallimastix californiae]|uniref:AMP-dependent synthetase/ligase domain-containing protein n=1 Tax=Neocallimastix californiae TaxID=1754190 RepID=A0A1Y2FKS6_9FUNG|nr:hypothetical protein LY90DRAFT_499307 [Neocallimastix californiae]|eukprot:ORY84591.1 hypothetical protein LY90DRAFT_499307 [Neocallimastix californiae]